MTVQGHEVTVKELPKCQFCDNQAAYDGRTVHGPWAFMCEADWQLHGVGQTGTGYGQKLVLDDTWTVVCGRCMFCEERSELKVATKELADAINAWKFAPQSKPFIQDAFPQLSPGDREQILTGSHEACFDAAFAE